MDAPLPRGGASLDARLLRFRSQPGSEDPATLARQLLEASRPADALDVLGIALRAAPGDPQLLLLGGHAWAQRGDLVRAQQALLEAARAAPQDPTPYRLLGEVLLKRGEPERAAKVLDKAAALAPNDPEVQKLKERAARLARIAGNAASPAADEFDLDAKTTVDAMPHMPPEARRPAPPAAPPAAPPRPAPARPRHPHDDDPPTSTMDRDKLPGLLRQSQPEAKAPPPVPPPQAAKPAPPPPAAAAPPPPGRPARKQTLLGAGAVAPTPPAARMSSDLRPTPEVPVAMDPSMRPTPAFPAGVGSTWRASVPPPPEDADEPTRRSSVPPGPPAASGPRRATSSRPPRARSSSTSGRVDAILHQLRAERVFEEVDAAAIAWSTAQESRVPKTRLWIPITILWVLALGAVVGGYFGYEKWTAHRAARARELVASAHEGGLRGDHEDLLRSLDMLREARTIEPSSAEPVAERLFIDLERVLEEGNIEPGVLRATTSTDAQRAASPALTMLADAMLALGRGDLRVTRAKLDEAIAAGGEDPRVAYVAGRLGQWMADERARDLLVRAAEHEPKLAAAQLAVAESEAADGDLDAAKARLDGVLAAWPQHLRATLLRASIDARDAEVDPALQALQALVPRLENGAVTDRVLVSLTRARLLRRKGDSAGATAAVEEAVRAGAIGPKLLAKIASEALALGLLTEAQRAATAALATVPSDTDTRRLLARVQIARRDGRRALQTLASLPADDEETLRLSGEAAILTDAGPALEAASAALNQYIEATEDPPVVLRALVIRLRARTAPGPEVVNAAKELARRAAGDPDATRALVEASLAAFDVETAVEAAERLVQSAPSDPDAKFLLGRARRMQGRAEEAVEAFQEALRLDEAHTDAKLALAYLQLDRGELEAADAIFRELGEGGGALLRVARLGRAEALLGLGRVADAKVQLEGLSPQDRERADALVVGAKVSLAEGQPGDAITALRPIAESEQANADVLALFGDALYAAGESNPASAAYERALTMDGTHPEALIGMATVFVRSQKHREALEALTRAEASLATRIRGAALQARLLVVRGRSLVEQRDTEGARQALQQATAIPGAPAEAWFFLGESLAAANTAEARAAYEKYIELAPDGPLVARARRAIR